MGFSCIGNDCVEFAVVNCIFDVRFAALNCKYYTYVFDGVSYEDVGDETKLILQSVA